MKTLRISATRSWWSRSWLPVLLLVLVAAIGVAGCGSSSSSGGPLLVASVNGHGVSLDDYQQMMNYVAKASAGSTSFSVQTPTGRQSISQAQTFVVGFLIDLELERQQASACNVSVSQKDIAAQQKQLQSTANTVLKDPSNSQYALFHALVSNSRVLYLYSERNAYQAAFVKVLNLPTANVRYILASNREQAKSIQQQADQGVDFAKLGQQAQAGSQSTTQVYADLGVLYIGQFIPDFDTVVYANATTSKPGCYNNLNLNKTPQKYQIYPLTGQFAGQYAVVETTNVANAPLSKVTDAQTQSNIYGAWLEEIVRFHAKVEKYALPPTSEQPTATPQQSTGA